MLRSTLKGLRYKWKSAKQLLAKPSHRIRNWKVKWSTFIFKQRRAARIKDKSATNVSAREVGSSHEKKGKKTTVCWKQFQTIHTILIFFFYLVNATRMRIFGQPENKITETEKCAKIAPIVLPSTATSCRLNPIWPDYNLAKQDAKSLRTDNKRLIVLKNCNHNNRQKNRGSAALLTYFFPFRFCLCGPVSWTPKRGYQVQSRLNGLWQH